ncbi:MAG: DUF1194 domain-containing protein [bacterium]|jgi:hypothetical protein|nr:DUF1194 domain-containing protein [Betaproteobacteria bacterium]
MRSAGSAAPAEHVACGGAIRAARRGAATLPSDISGDGRNESGVAVTTARDAAVAQGITLDRQPIGNQSLITCCRNNVIGGTGTFVEPACSRAPGRKSRGSCVLCDRAAHRHRCGFTTVPSRRKAAFDWKPMKTLL